MGWTRIAELHRALEPSSAGGSCPTVVLSGAKGRGGACSHRLQGGLSGPRRGCAALASWRNLRDADLLEWVVTWRLEALPVSGAFRQEVRIISSAFLCQWQINVLSILYNSFFPLFYLSLWLS